jgi:hypothetical protein
MELNSLRLFTRISVHILDFDNFRHVLDNFHYSFELIHLDQIDDLLLEELEKSNVTFIAQFWIFLEILFHLDC